MILISSWSRLCPTLWSQVLSRQWRCSWSSADRRCSNYIWVIDNLIAHWGASFIRDLTVRGTPYLSPMGELYVFGANYMCMWRTTRIWGELHVYGANYMYMGRTPRIWGELYVYGANYMYMGRTICILRELYVYGASYMYLYTVFCLYMSPGVVSL